MQRVKVWAVLFFNGNQPCSVVCKTRREAETYRAHWRRRYTAQGMCCFQIISYDQNVPDGAQLVESQKAYARWARSKARVRSVRGNLRALERQAA